MQCSRCAGVLRKVKDKGRGRRKGVRREEKGEKRMGDKRERRSDFLRQGDRECLSKKLTFEQIQNQAVITQTCGPPPFHQCTGVQ